MARERGQASVELVAAIPVLLPASPARRGSIDVGGALAATAGLALTVFGVVRAPEEGWGSTATLGAIAGGITLLAGFVVIQAARREPLRQRRTAARGPPPKGPGWWAAQPTGLLPPHRLDPLRRPLPRC